MDMINPIVWANSMLTSSSVGEDSTYAAWDSSAFYSVGDRRYLASTHRVYECLIPHQSVASLTTSSAVTMAVATSLVTWTGHGLLNGARVIFSNVSGSTSTGTLPTGVSVNVPYYVSSTTSDTFKLKAKATDATEIVFGGSVSGTFIATSGGTSPDNNLSGDSPLWLDYAPTNKYAMFDDKWGTQTKSNNSLTVTLAPGVPIDSLGLLNLRGRNVRVVCKLGVTKIYDKSFTLQTDVGVYDWSTYFLAPIVAKDDLVLNDLFPYNTQTIEITVTGPNTVAIGNITMGSKVHLGELEYHPTVSIIDYSRKDIDEYGNVVIVKRAYSKRFSAHIEVDTRFVDQLASILASVRSTPVLWAGAGSDYSSLIIWGFYKDFEIDLASFSKSYCTLTIEGIT